MDELIDQELQALRRPVESKRGLGDAVLAMRSPIRSKWLLLKWPVRIGSAAALAGAVVLGGSLVTANAYAGELRAIEAAEQQQKTRHQKSYLFNKTTKPVLIMEFWNDHEKEAYRQFSADGKLEIARVFDGQRKYHYVAPDSVTGRGQWASVEDARYPDFGIETINSILSGRLARDNKIEKKTGVKFDGRVCDYYSIAKGYYRIWVEPATKLPLKREIYDKGVTLWKRDIYQYPASFPAAVFKPFKTEGVKYTETKSKREGSR